MSDVLTPAAIIQAERSRVKRIPVEEWGGVQCIRPLPTAVMIRFDDIGGNGTGPDTVPLSQIVNEYGCLILLHGMCDEDGGRVFASEEDVRAFLSEASLLPVSGIIGDIMDHTAAVAGIETDEDTATDETVEALVKN